MGTIGTTAVELSEDTALGVVASEVAAAALVTVELGSEMTALETPVLTGASLVSVVAVDDAYPEGSEVGGALLVSTAEVVDSVGTPVGAVELGTSLVASAEVDVSPGAVTLLVTGVVVEGSSEVTGLDGSAVSEVTGREVGSGAAEEMSEVTGTEVASEGTEETPEVTGREVGSGTTEGISEVTGTEVASEMIEETSEVTGGAVGSGATERMSDVTGIEVASETIEEASEVAAEGAGEGTPVGTDEISDVTGASVAVTEVGYPEETCDTTEETSGATEDNSVVTGAPVAEGSVGGADETCEATEDRSEATEETSEVTGMPVAVASVGVADTTCDATEEISEAIDEGSEVTGGGTAMAVVASVALAEATCEAAEESSDVIEERSEVTGGGTAVAVFASEAMLETSDATLERAGSSGAVVVAGGTPDSTGAVVVGDTPVVALGAWLDSPVAIDDAALDKMLEACNASSEDSAGSVAVAAMLEISDATDDARSEVRAKAASEIALVSSDPIDETIAEASVVTGRGTIGVTPEIDTLVVTEAASVVAAAEVVVATLLCSVTTGAGTTAVSLVLGASLNSGVVLSVELATEVGCGLPDATRLASVAEVATTEGVADVSSEGVTKTTELASGTRGTTAPVVVELALVAGPVTPSTDEEFELLGREDAGDSAVVIGVEVPSMTVESPRMIPVAEVEVGVGADELMTVLVG
ncbi:hypothetical protein H2199_008232 [Coniosporium tulheliwenetii]|uniref:Uncharacterized protein n=1 Tax=Coniosporium tulheliwenetii TaxID=3383036 RepID=A0ACC2YL78_9PEZI|nr:hypothetical protein H2199_008232 [Cladosporium sp. JES 115]